MPIYEYACECGTRFERYLPVAEYLVTQTCECGKTAEKLISRVHVYVQPDICYDSPIDGRPITSLQARLDDLARNNCIPYDPEMKKDTDRKIREDQERLEKSVDEFVEKSITTMPTRKREKLEAELTSGVDVEPVRQTLGA